MKPDEWKGDNDNRAWEYVNIKMNAAHRHGEEAKPKRVWVAGQFYDGFTPVWRAQKGVPWAREDEE